MHHVRAGSACVFLIGTLIALFAESRVARVYGIGLGVVCALLFASAVPWRSIWSSIDLLDLTYRIMGWRWTQEAFIMLALLLTFGVVPALIAPSGADVAIALLCSLIAGLLFTLLLNWSAIRGRMRGMRDVTHEIRHGEETRGC